MEAVFVVDEMHSAPHLYARQTVYDQTCKLTEKDYEMDDVMLQWRKARAAYELAVVADTPREKRKALLNEARVILKRCIILDRNNAEIHRWMGLVVVSLAEFMTTAQQITASYEASDEWRQAVQMSPADATAHHLLGCWAYDQAAWSWWYRWFASALYATPPQASWEDARDQFAAAERIAPGAWKKNQVMLARTYNKMGDSKRASQWAARALRCRTASKEDLKAHADALQMLRGLDAEAAKDAADEGLEDVLTDAVVAVPVEDREDGFKGEPVPVMPAGSAVSRVSRLIG